MTPLLALPAWTAAWLSTALPGASTPSPSGSATEDAAVEDTTSAVEAAQMQVCAVADGTFCGRLRAWGVPRDIAQELTGYGLGFLQIVAIITIGLVARWLLHRAIGRLTERIAGGEVGAGRRPSRRAVQVHVGADGDPDSASGAHVTSIVESSAFAGERRAQRARTVGSVLRSATTAVITVTVVLLVLGVFGINVGPLIAGAGVLGVALGFGSQTLVKDFLSGIFLIIEDQYGVGDVVDLGDASGSVEAVGLRVTRLRAVDGTVWYVRNGEILRVGNQSQGWARAVLDIDVAYGEDVTHVQDLLREIASEFFEDPDWQDLVLEEPEVWGVEALAPGSVVVRLVIKTVPLEQWKVAREMRRRIKARFDREGVEIPFPQQTVWLRSEREDGAPAPGRTSAPPHAVQDRHDPPPAGESEATRTGQIPAVTKDSSGL